MNISEVEERLENIRLEHGDIEVVVNDADTGWLFKLIAGDFAVVNDDKGHRVEIEAGYSSEFFNG